MPASIRRLIRRGTDRVPLYLLHCLFYSLCRTIEHFCPPLAHTNCHWKRTYRVEPLNSFRGWQKGKRKQPRRIYRLSRINHLNRLPTGWANCNCSIKLDVVWKPSAPCGVVVVVFMLLSVIIIFVLYLSHQWSVKIGRASGMRYDWWLTDGVFALFSAFISLCTFMCATTDTIMIPFFTVALKQMLWCAIHFFANALSNEHSTAYRVIR